MRRHGDCESSRLTPKGRSMRLVRQPLLASALARAVLSLEIQTRIRSAIPASSVSSATSIVVMRASVSTPRDWLAAAVGVDQAVSAIRLRASSRRQSAGRALRIPTGLAYEPRGGHTYPPRRFPLERPSRGLRVEMDHARHHHDAGDTKVNLLRSSVPLANPHPNVAIV